MKQTEKTRRKRDDKRRRRKHERTQAGIAAGGPPGPAPANADIPELMPGEPYQAIGRWLPGDGQASAMARLFCVGICDTALARGPSSVPFSGSGALMALQADGEQYPWVIPILPKGPPPSEASFLTANWKGKRILLRIEPPSKSHAEHFVLCFQDLGNFVGRTADMHRLWRFFAAERERESELPRIAQALLSFPTPQKDTERHKPLPGFLPTGEIMFPEECLAREVNVGYGTNADGKHCVVLSMLGNDGPLAITSYDSFAEVMAVVVDLMGAGQSIWGNECDAFRRATLTREGKDAFLRVHQPKWAK